MVLLSIGEKYLLPTGKCHPTGEPWIGGNIEERMKSMEDENIWRMVDRNVFPASGEENSIVCFAFEVL